MVFEHAVLKPQQAPDQRLVLYSPRPEHDTPEKLARLIEGVKRSAPARALAG
jgi:hypothetical protein